MGGKSSFSNTLNASDLEAVKNCKIQVIVSLWNTEITAKLEAAAIEILNAHSVQFEIIYVPGAFEVPLAAKWCLDHQQADAIICLSCVVQGETDHNIYINHAVAKGIMDLSLNYNTPVIFGVLTTLNYQQALDRAGGSAGNKGADAAFTALKMIALKKDKF